MHTLGLFWRELEAVNSVGFCIPFPILPWRRACYLCAGDSHHFLMYFCGVKKLIYSLVVRCPRSRSIALLFGGEVEVS